MMDEELGKGEGEGGNVERIEKFWVFFLVISFSEKGFGWCQRI